MNDKRLTRLKEKFTNAKMERVTPIFYKQLGKLLREHYDNVTDDEIKNIALFCDNRLAKQF